MKRLCKGHVELAGAIDQAHEALLNRCPTLKTWAPPSCNSSLTFKVEASKSKAFRSRNDWSKLGQMSRIVLSILRQVAEPLTSRDIALELFVERALDKDDRTINDCYGS
jgi:hypothetical protein